MKYIIGLLIFLLLGVPAHGSTSSNVKSGITPTYNCVSGVPCTTLGPSVTNGANPSPDVNTSNPPPSSGAGSNIDPCASGQSSIQDDDDKKKHKKHKKHKKNKKSSLEKTIEKLIKQIEELLKKLGITMPINPGNPTLPGNSTNPSLPSPTSGLPDQNPPSAPDQQQNLPCVSPSSDIPPSVGGPTNGAPSGVASPGVSTTVPSPQLSPGPGVSSGPSNGTVDFRGDYDPGNISQWARASMVSTSTSFQAVASPLRQGKFAGKFTVRPGDKPSSSGERAEVMRDPSGDEKPGTTHFYAWSTFFPADWQACTGYQIFLQFHGVGDTMSPPVSMRAQGDSIVLRTRGGPTDTDIHDFPVAPSLNKGKWNDFILKVKWSTGTDGQVTVWHRVEGGAFAQKVSANVATLHNSSGTYMRQGLYRSGCSATNILYHDGTRRGSTYDAVLADFAK